MACATSAKLIDDMLAAHLAYRTEDRELHVSPRTRYSSLVTRVRTV